MTSQKKLLSLGGIFLKLITVEVREAGVSDVPVKGDVLKFGGGMLTEDQLTGLKGLVVMFNALVLFNISISSILTPNFPGR